MTPVWNAEVQYSLVRNFARQTPINVTVTSLAIAFTTWMVWPFVPQVLSVPWVILHAGLPALIYVRWSLRRRAHRHVDSVAQIPRASLEVRAARAQMRAILFALYSGVLWGSTVGAMQYLPDRYQVALVIIVGALAGGATTTLSAIPMAAGLYALTAIMPFSAYFFMEGTDPASISVGALAAVMACGMVWASRSVHGTFLDDVAARVEATHALDELRAARDDWMQVAQSADAFALFDEHKHLKFRNQAFLKSLAVHAQRAPVGATLAELIASLAPSEETNMGLVTHLERQARYARQEHQIDEPLIERFADGRWLRSVMRRTDTGSLVWLIQDITDERPRESTEIKLRARLAEAKQLQTIGQFAGGVAHDFNNVLGAIQAFAEYFTGQSDPADTQNAARRIVSACERGAGMVRNIMQLATASRVEKEVFRLSEAFQQAINLMPARKTKDITLESEDKTNGAYIDANQSQVVQLIMNLGVNALSALKPSVGLVSIRAACIDIDIATASQFFDAAAGLDGVMELPDGSSQYIFGMLLPNRPYIKITVEDSGTGIEPAFLSRIFDPFVSTKDTTMRTGFGLAVVRSVVLAAEGALSVRSRLGHGTTFDVYLAIVPAPTDAVAPAEAFSPSGKSAQILIVDDDVDVADGLALALQGLGHTTRIMYDPRDALKVYQTTPMAWPVAILDLSMPHLSGDELAAEIHKLNPQARLFIYTGRASEALEVAAAKIGVEAVLQKPIDAQTLSALINRAG